MVTQTKTETRQTSTTIRQCGYCGYKGTDVNHVGHYYIGGKGDVEFPICDDAGACISRVESNKEGGRNAKTDS
jgi:hypothetical protein